MKKASKILMFLASIATAVTLVGCAQPHSHSFSSDCDTTCNTCDYTREVETEHTATDDGDCTTALICEICEDVKIEAKDAHTPEADDGDCTTAVKCNECDKTAVEAKDAHTPEADDGDCTTAVECTECDKNAVEAKSAHTPATDDGDCTTAVECLECDKNAVEAKDAHEFGADDGKCVHCEIVADAKVEDVFYIDFNEALSNWSDGTTLKLYSDISSGSIFENIEILNKSVTLDLNGHVLDGSSVGVLFYVGNEEVPTGSLTIQDSGSNGVVKALNSVATVYGTLNLKSGTLESGVQSTKTGVINISGGKVIGQMSIGLFKAVGNYGILNISGGTLYGGPAIENQTSGVVNISGSPIIEGKENLEGYGALLEGTAAAISNKGTVIIDGSPIFKSTKYEIYVFNPVTILTQPNEGATWRVNVDKQSLSNNVVIANPGTGITLDPGKFVSAVDGYGVVKNADGSLALALLGKAVAGVDGKLYTDFNDALNNWTDGTTLTLYSDIADGTNGTIEILNKSVSLDLNGYVWDMSSISCPIYVGMATAKEWTDGSLSIYTSQNGGKIKGGSYSLFVAGTLNLYGGILENGVLVNTYGTINMKGGTVKESTYDYIGIDNYGTVNLSGGIINATYCVYNREDSITNVLGPITLNGFKKGNILGTAIYNKGNVVISEAPVFKQNENNMDLQLVSPITLKTQPKEGEVWRVYMITSHITANNGVFAIPGEGVDLDATKFVSTVDGYEVTKLTNGSLALTPIA